jgi:multidrug efflux pump subunit AcrA (membrane-fusion protein)
MLKRFGVLQFKWLFAAFLAIVVLFALFKEIEVVVTGKGRTVINESDVILKSPFSGFIDEVFVSQGQTIAPDQALLKVFLVEEEYEYQQLVERLRFKERQRDGYIEEGCFLTSADQFRLSRAISFFSYNCDGVVAQVSAGGLYITQFYEDYLQELDYRNQVQGLNIELLQEFNNKKSSLIKQRDALQLGRAETVRFFDLEVSISDLNSEITRFNISLKDLDKRIRDKQLYFEMRRSERVLALEESLQKVEEELLDLAARLRYLDKRLELTTLRSPVEGIVLQRSDNVSRGVYVEQGSVLLTLKKQGFSREVEARFDTRYRHFLAVDLPVRLKINSPGYLELFEGRILDISADAIPDEQDNKVKYYRVTIQPDERFNNLALDLGIDVEVYLIEDKVTPMTYIMSVIPAFDKVNVW